MLWLTLVWNVRLIHILKKNNINVRKDYYMNENIIDIYINYIKINNNDKINDTIKSTIKVLTL